MTGEEATERDLTLAKEREREESDDLLGIPGMRESILDGLATPLDETSEEPGW